MVKNQLISNFRSNFTQAIQTEDVIVSLLNSSSNLPFELANNSSSLLFLSPPFYPDN